MSFRSFLFASLLVLFGGSLAARAWLSPPSSDGTNSGHSASQPDGPVSSFSANSPTGSLPLVSPDEPSEPEGAAKALPYVTEGSFFGIIGFALGFATRKVVKLFLLLIGGLFVLVQGLSYLQVVTVDWSRAVDLTNDLVLNLKHNQSIGEVLKDRIPTAGALVAGFALGYRKG